MSRIMNLKTGLFVWVLVVGAILISGCVGEKRSISLDNPVDICNAIRDNDLKNECLGIVKKDISFCEKISEKYAKEDCKYHVAVLEDVELCKKIIPENYCLAYAKNDPALCEKGEDDNKIYCYRELAIINKNASLCEKIDTIGDRTICYLWVAIMTENSSLCKKAGIREDAPIVGKCINILIKKDETKCKDYLCYSRIAAAKKDVSICEKIKGDQIGKDICYYMVAVRLVNATIFP